MSHRGGTTPKPVLGFSLDSVRNCKSKPTIWECFCFHVLLQFKITCVTACICLTAYLQRHLRSFGHCSKNDKTFETVPTRMIFSGIMQPHSKVFLLKTGRCLTALLSGLKYEFLSWVWNFTVIRHQSDDWWHVLLKTIVAAVTRVIRCSYLIVGWQKVVEQ